MMFRSLLIIWLTIMAFLYTGCSNNVEVASGTRGGNPVQGLVEDESGSAAPDIIVSLVPVMWNPAEPDGDMQFLMDTTDEAGKFAWADVEQGTYNIEARSENGSLMAFKQQIAHEKGAETDAGVLSLASFGTLKVYIPAGLRDNAGVVFLEGTSFFQTFAADQEVVDFELPAGSLPAVMYVSESSPVEPVVLTDDPQITSDEESVISEYETWLHSNVITVNTSGLFPDNSTKLYNYPLLVRVDNSLFDFSQAEAGGADLRATGRHGQSLAVDIEYWDALAGQGAFWVSLDSLTPGISDVAFVLYWGQNTGQPSIAGGVFDSSLGFAGVWHLAEDMDGADGQAIYNNSVSSGNLGNDSISATGKDGIIGRGQNFITGDNITVPNVSEILKPAASHTISIWMKVTDTVAPVAELLSMGNDYALRINGEMGLRAFIYDADTTRNFVQDSTSLSDGNWHFCAARYENSLLELFVDGVKVGESMDVFPEIDYNGGPDLIMGSHGNNFGTHYFQGALDEARVYWQPRSPEWIKMDYETQKPGTGVLEW